MVICHNGNVTALPSLSPYGMDAKWLTEQFARPGYSQAGLAKETGWHPSTINKMVKGKRPIRVTEADAIYRYFGMASPLSISTPPDGPMKSDVRLAPNAPGRPYRGDWQVDVPVMGNAVGGDEGDFEMNGTAVFHAPRPPQFVGRADVFAVIVQNNSMSPWREPGSLAYAESRKPPRNGDYVIIEMKAARGDHVRPAFLKKLVAMTPTKFKLQQYEPAKQFEVDRDKVFRMYRVLDADELMGV
jgi:phage repressor protein C with HTH and peptisase S24 domain